MGELESLQANLRAAMRFFGEGSGRGEVQQLPGSLAIYSGLDYGVFNIGLLGGPRLEAEGDGAAPENLEAPLWQPSTLDELRDSLDQCARYFDRRSPRWSVWVCNDALDQKARWHAAGLLAQYNLRHISTAPGMVAGCLAPPCRELPAIECIPVDDERTRQAFGGVTSVSFDIPMPVVQAVYHPERGWQGAYRGYLGVVRGRPVSMVAIVAAADYLGIYSLATMPEERRRGYGEALLRAALGRESQRTGIQRMLLQSTDAGHALYKRLGFREVAKFSVFLTR